jgi:tRNA(adenine34) deaminase
MEHRRNERLPRLAPSSKIRDSSARGPCTAGERVDDQDWMAEALAEARRAAAIGEVPIGAVVVRSDEIVGRGYNRREVDCDPLAHAEMLAIREAARRCASWRLTGCTLYATLEPCPMCAGALVASRIERLVFGAADPKAGFCGSLANLAQDPRLNHRLQVSSGVLAEESAALLRSFFGGLRLAKS